ncbi:MAG: hypothetical protein RSA29_16980 [Clostridium sp.]|uniref:hypothetical protein n=1 Tax=Clostridium sp. TaxID=1506 RepID=UPI00302206BB
MELKIVEEYSKEMTREEFDKFTEEEELCPSSLGLSNSEESKGCNNCNNCWDEVLIGIEFIKPLPALPKESVAILARLADIEKRYKVMEEERDNLKSQLLEAMEKHLVTKWENDDMSIKYVAPTTKSSIDSKSLKKDMPYIFEKYSKTSHVKSSVRFKLKEVK